MHVDRRSCPPFLLVAAVLGLAGCPADNGELGSLIQEADERAAVVQGVRDEGSLAPAKRNRYVKRQGLHLDAPYFAGRELASIEDSDVADQLGVEISREAVSEGETHIVFDKAEIWVLDGTIYRIRSQLAHTMDIPTALGVSGFPLSLGTPIDGARNVRWNRAWSTRRIELIRSEEDRRLFTHIDVYKFLPRENR